MPASRRVFFRRRGLPASRSVEKARVMGMGVPSTRAARGLALPGRRDVGVVGRTCDRTSGRASRPSETRQNGFSSRRFGGTPSRAEWSRIVSTVAADGRAETAAP